MQPTEPDLVHWRAAPDRKQALEFTAQGWALAEACAIIGEYGKPQALIIFMLSRIICGLFEGDPKNGPELNVDWRVKGGLTASVSFQSDALKALAAVCDMEVGELQSAMQSSLELALLDMYDEYKGRQQFH